MKVRHAWLVLIGRIEITPEARVFMELNNSKNALATLASAVQSLIAAKAADGAQAASDAAAADTALAAQIGQVTDSVNAVLNPPAPSA